jgi:hypothetical protein
MCSGRPFVSTLLARDLGYLSPDAHRQLDAQVREVRRMLACFMQKPTQ